MFSKIKYSKNSISFPKGFISAGISASIKKNNDKDLALLVSSVPCSASGFFTQNQFIAPPIQYSKNNLQKYKKAQAIIVNSGNANACTGKNGVKSVNDINASLSKNLNIDKNLILQFSTGKIGHPMPVKKITDSMQILKDNLKPLDYSFSNAIMTTDTFSKNMSAEYTIQNKKVRIGATVKGAGMIEPSMATMLCFITSDISMPSNIISSLLKETVDQTFNTISVDGDMSTNDSIVLLCNGLSNVKVKTKTDEAFLLFKEALLKICSFLSSEIVRDGEGATKVMNINISGAKSCNDAKKVARSIGNSLLLKCAMFGEKPNWGRILSSIGATNAKINFSNFSVSLQKCVCFKNNEPNFKAHQKLEKAMKKKNIEIDVKLGAGAFKYKMLASDLSFQYVEINK